MSGADLALEVTENGRLEHPGILGRGRAAALPTTRENRCVRRRLDLSRPLDLRATLFPLRRGAGDPTMRMSAVGAVRATRTPDGPVTLQLRLGGAHVEADAQGSGAAWALEHLPDLIGEHDGVEDFHPRHALVSELFRRHPGLRIIRSGAVLEAMVPSILEQEIVGLDARANYARLVRTLGDVAPGAHGLLVPPTPGGRTTTVASNGDGRRSSSASRAGPRGRRSISIWIRPKPESVSRPSLEWDRGSPPRSPSSLSVTPMPCLLATTICPTW
ncbi:MAG: hypothetical protein ACR2GX_04515 [Candidatus Dormibacteria bacterium]